ncbi:MAG: 30S ribosomal protein S3, partial [SAR324 cluster bacterium]|nr:30S ribosomal protein S3 [SAR324 cluster bacterium]
MGQKVNPIGFRLCVNKNWNSRWYAEKSYAETLKEDLDIQYFVKNRLKKASISKI